MSVYKARFQIDDSASFEGYTRGDLWNGFACPRFTKEEGLKIVQHFNTEDYPARFNEEKDQFEFTMDDYKDEGSLDVTTPVNIEFEGNELKVYPIGAWGWIWDEVKEEEDE